MGTSIDKLNYMSTTKTKIKDAINLTNINISNDTFRSYETKFKQGIINTLNNPDAVWSNFTKVTGTGESLTLTPTEHAPMLVTLKGQTTQSSTPTPSNPVPINVVTGEQDIEVCGRNILKLKNKTSTTTNTVTYSIENGIVAINGTASAGFTIDIELAETITSNETYYIVNTLFNENVTAPNNIDWCGSSFWGFSGWRNGTYTLPSGKTISKIRFIIASGQVFNNMVYKPMLVKGEVAPTTYEPYTGNTYEINLGYENLWKNQKTGWLPQSGAYPTTMSGYPNARYVLVYLYANQKLTLSNSTNNQGRVRCIDKDTNQVVNSFTSTDTTYYTTTHVFGDGFYEATITAKKDFIVGIMDMSGNINDLVVNYGPKPQTTTNNPIELCKIGTYQDKIYRENGIWYLHKEIGKYTLPLLTNVVGIYDYSSSETQASKNGTFAIFKWVIGDNVSNNTMLYSMANYEYKSSIDGNVTAQNNLSDNSFCMRQGTNDRIYFKCSVFTGKTGNQIAQEIQGTTLYYVLATPTNTPIEDSELIEQLESIKSCDGITNISQSSNNNISVIDATAIKQLGGS